MNQDQIKAHLLRLNAEVPDFQVILTGKSSQKVHGLYKPESKEILLHNKNFHSETELIYTAIHEFAHHVHFSMPARPQNSKSHNSMYWNIFHRLLRKAEELDIYKNIFITEPEFIALTDKIKTNFLKENGQLMKDFGKLLLQATELCQKYHARFEDYMDRVLCISRTTARTLIQSFNQDIDPAVGYDQMKTLVSVQNPQFRKELEKKIQLGYSHEMIRQEIRNQDESSDFEMNNPEREIQKLINNRDNLKKRIESLQIELDRLDAAIKEKQEDYL